MTQNHLINVVEEEEAKKKRLQFNAFLSDELIAEILSFLNVKTIVRLKCVSKSWNTLISDPTFVHEHLNKSTQNPHLIVTPPFSKYPIKSFPVSRLLANPSTSSVSGYNSRNSKCEVVNSCNGLLCMLFSSNNRKGHICNYRFCLWNPATRTSFDQHYNPRPLLDSVMFTFGCDILTGTYKVVASLAERDDGDDWICQVRVFSLGDNCWRNINSFPLTPLISDYNNGVHLSGTVSWLAIREYNFPVYDNIYIEHVEQFMIVSLNLSTETCTQFLLPSGFDQVPLIQPTLQVLMDRLCFSHDFKTTEFVIWQMKDFGVHESWTRLFRIGYFNPEMALLIGPDTPLLPVYQSKNGDTLILAHCMYDQAIIYNQRENRVDRIRNSNKVSWFSYVESLVSPHWKYATPTPSTSSAHGSMVEKFVPSLIDDEIGEVVGDSSEEELEGFLLSEDSDEDSVDLCDSEDELSDSDSEDDG